MANFENKVVIITGAASGMGKEYAYAFAKQGAKVVLGDLNENVLKVAADIGKNAAGLVMNVASSEDWQKAVNLAHEKFGKVTILINNAGIADQTPFEYLTEEAFRRSMDVNLMSDFYGCKAVLEDMKASNWGRIVNVSSIAGVRGVGDSLAYIASKHAVTGLTKSCAHAFGKYNILINAICPGVVDTPMMATLKEKYPEAIAAIIGAIPVGHMADPKEIVGLVQFLCSEDNTFVNGENIVIDGGQYC